MSPLTARRGNGGSATAAAVSGDIDASRKKSLTSWNSRSMRHIHPAVTSAAANPASANPVHI